MTSASQHMDRMYRYQRHIYDFTRKPYLLGRDVLIAGLQPPAGGCVLEIGCGTARNLVKVAQAYPQARCCGIDVSSRMLATARLSVDRGGVARRVRLALADATGFAPESLFGQAEFEDPMRCR